MSNSKSAQKSRRSEKLWLPSLLLLLGQFLTITPALLIVLADEQQRKASDGYVALLDKLDSISSALAELETVPPQGASLAGGSAWQQHYADYREAVNRTLASAAVPPEIRETLAQVDANVERMAKTASDPAAFKTASFREDGHATRSELASAERSVRLQLSTTGHSLTQLNTYLKALVGGACLLAFGVVFLVRKFRIDAALQRELQEELRTSNEEVVTALAAARSESESKNKFLAHVGNLMRTPLDALAGRTKELLGTELTADQRDSIQATREVAESLTRVAGQVADYSNMQSGGLALESIEFQPGEIVADMLHLFSLPAERKGLKLKSAVSKDLPGTLKGDPERLRQILANLLSNAVRFTQRGEILLRAEEVAGTEGRTSLRFEVKDTGVGISDELRDQIFQPFRQINGSASGKDQGTGLGLAISKKLVELMGGKIDVAGEAGRGCTFSFTAVFESVRTTGDRRSESTEPAPAATPADSPVNSASKNGKKGHERRTEPRQGINYPTLLRSEQAGIAIIRVLDVSTSGLRVSVPFRLTVLSEVEIRIEGASVVGTVRNCNCIAANEFHVGIELRPASSNDEHFLHHLRLLRTERST